LNEESPNSSDEAGNRPDAKNVPGLSSLHFEPDTILMRDPGILLNRSFLGALHAELLDELGSAKADMALLQMGFVHGLQDAFDAVQAAFEEPTWSGAADASSPLVSPPLAIRMGLAIGGDGSEEQRAAIAVNGSWPESNEASAVLETLGQPDHAICFLSAGYTSGWLSGTLEIDILAIESNCGACGAASCEFTAYEVAQWRAFRDPQIDAMLDSLPFEALRDFIRLNREAVRDATKDFKERDDSFSRVTPQNDGERVESVVHIWGPVMVIPFASGDEALRAVDLLGRDPAAQDVSVVVVDLSGAVIDDAFGAVALEQTLDLVEAWGAEVIFAATTPMSEPAVRDLERQPLFIIKDLPTAIATAFQIADAQRRPS
jgi:anti-anti-sigma regulatory factor